MIFVYQEHNTNTQLHQHNTLTKATDKIFYFINKFHSGSKKTFKAASLERKLFAELLLHVPRQILFPNTDICNIPIPVSRTTALYLPNSRAVTFRQ